MSKQLSKTDYEILNQKQDKFDMLIGSQYMSYLDGSFVGEMSRIYQDHFNEPLRTTCPACLMAGMLKLHKKMEEYRSNNTQP